MAERRGAVDFWMTSNPEFSRERGAVSDSSVPTGLSLEQTLRRRRAPRRTLPALARKRCAAGGNGNGYRRTGQIRRQRPARIGNRLYQRRCRPVRKYRGRHCGGLVGALALIGGSASSNRARIWRVLLSIGYRGFAPTGRLQTHRSRSLFSRVRNPSVAVWAWRTRPTSTMCGTRRPSTSCLSWSSPRRGPSFRSGSLELRPRPELDRREAKRQPLERDGQARGAAARLRCSVAGSGTSSRPEIPML
jgi:hypothetical protein